jgi:cell wall assembly regulator SMI1
MDLPDSRLVRILDDVNTWLAAHAPALGNPFSGPVEPAELARAEQALGGPLPADYRAFLGRHDGQRLVPAGANWRLSPFVRHMELLPLKFALREHQSMVEDWGDEGPGDIVARGPVRPLYKHTRWLPVVLLHGSSQYLCIDLDPAPGGTPGQVIWLADDDEQRRVVAPSFTAFLEALRDALKSPDTTLEKEELELPDDLFDRLLGGS